MDASYWTTMLYGSSSIMFDGIKSIITVWVRHVSSGLLIIRMLNLFFVKKSSEWGLEIKLYGNRIQHLVGPQLAPCFAELLWRRALHKDRNSRLPKINLTNWSQVRSRKEKTELIAVTYTETSIIHILRSLHPKHGFICLILIIYTLQ